MLPVSELPMVPYAITAFAEATYGSLLYTIEDNEVIITGCDPETTALSIPDSIEGLPVSKIANSAFSTMSKLQSVTLPSHLTAIPFHCFFDCESLTSVVLPEDLTDIDMYAFANCTNLKEITFPASLRTIHTNAFSGTGLTDIVLPEGVEVIREAFMACCSLKSISIPSTVTDLENALAGCTSLETILVDPDNAYYQTVDNVLLTKNGKRLLVYPPAMARTSYTVPETVTTIPNYAFANLKDLTSITLPPYMTAIGEGAFMNCSGLKQITIPDGIKYIESMTFYGCSSLEKITLPKSLTKIYRQAFTCPLLTEIDYEGSVLDWSKITIPSDNQSLFHASVHFGEEDTTAITDVTLYTTASALPVPEENTSYQIQTAGENALFRIIAGDTVLLSDTGLVTPIKQRYGETIIRITEGNDISFLRVTAADYAPVYADEILSAFLAEHISEDMSDFEKLQVIGKLPASMDYDSNYYEYAQMIAFGKGNCAGSATMLVEMCRRLGIKAWVRNADRDPGAGSAHVNALAEVDGCYYELEAGYNGTAPRPYNVTKRTSLYKYKDIPDGIDVYQYDGINKQESLLEIPDRIDDKVVTRIGDDFLKENPWVKSVTIPDSVTEISDSAFPDYQGILFGAEGSAAEEFAKAHDIAFRATGSLATGDVNADGDIDIMDVIAVNKYLLGGSLLNQSQCVAADVDADGEVTTTDSLIILKYVVDMIDSFNP